MQMNEQIMKMARASSSGSVVSNHCSGGFLNDMGPAVLLAVVFGVGVLLTTGCSSTDRGVNATLIAPVTSAQQDAVREDDGFYQPRKIPGFNDLTGS
jgi:hypothetical protein